MDTVLTVKNWLDLVTSPNNKYPDFASKRFPIHSVFKNCHPGERIRKVPIRMSDIPNTCERKPYLERKSCGFKNIRIRVTIMLFSHCLNILLPHFYKLEKCRSSKANCLFLTGTHTTLALWEHCNLQLRCCH